MCGPCEMVRVYRESKIQDGAPLLYPVTSVYRHQQQQQTVMVQYQTPMVMQQPMQQQQIQMQQQQIQMQQPYAPQVPMNNYYQPQYGEGNATNM